ncbi:MAG: hypothetical protein E7570_02835 [Ruminococcaceae bacterium]|nr:hypothetical protein [Oscillospiraceae bacterium]
MENKRYKLSFVISFILLISSIILYGVKLRFGLENSFNYVIYGFVFLMLGILAYQSFKEESYPPAFEIKKNNANAYSAFLAGIGFLIDFISNGISVYFTLTSKRIIPAEVATKAAALVFALLSSLYFMTVFLTYKYNSYDFRKLKYLHLAPLLWALSGAALTVLNAVAFREDMFSAIKGLTLIFATLFFFSFIQETESKGSAKKALVFFVGAFSYLCLLLVAVKFFDLRYRNAVLLHEDSAFAVTSLLLFTFAHYFRNNILSPRI